MKKYYLHVWSGGELDDNTVIVDKTTSPLIIGNVGLEIDDWPADDLFRAWPEYFTTNRLKTKLIYWQFTGIEFCTAKKISIGRNFEANYPTVKSLEYWWFKIIGIAGQDDFGHWKRLYLIVSEKALNFLRDNHVTHAESIEIIGNIDDFFQSDKHKFWI